MQVPDTLATIAVPIDDVNPYEHNPRRGDLDALTASLKVNGQYRPIVANRRTGDVLAGNHTWQAAKALEVRIAGVSYAKIASTMGLADPLEARAAVLTALDADELDDHGDAILLDVQRLDRLTTALWPRAVKGDLGAVDRLMKLSEARLRLLSPHPTPAPASVQSTPLAAVTVGALTPTARSA